MGLRQGQPMRGTGDLCLYYILVPRYIYMRVCSGELVQYRERKTLGQYSEISPTQWKYTNIEILRLNAPA